MLCAPARPANAAKRSGIVNYDIERGQSFEDEVIRVTRSGLRPQNRRGLHLIDTHFDQRRQEAPHSARHQMPLGGAGQNVYL